MKIITQRIYAGSPLKGYRVLVDRLWPRGISKQTARLDGWWKDVAPSTMLRKWFDHDIDNWTEFRLRYWLELEKNKNRAEELMAEASAAQDQLVLLYGAKSETCNHALVLKEFLDQL